MAFGFNPQESARSFAAATEEDPACALCWWGLAWSLGPNINTDMTDEAKRRVAKRSPVPAPSPRKRRPGRARSSKRFPLRHPARGAPDAIDEEAYARRMVALSKRFPGDADIALLAAESIMNLHPYDWWGRTGRPAVDGRNRDASRPRHRRRTRTSGRAALPRPPVRVVRATGTSACRGRPAARPRAGLAAPAAHARAHLHAHRALRGGDRGELALHRGRPPLPGAGRCAGRLPRRLCRAQPPFPLGVRGDARPERARHRGGPRGLHRGLRPEHGRPHDRDAAAPRRAAAPCAGALREMGRDPRALPPDTREPYPLAVYHFARGTAFARTGKIDLARAELARLEHGRRRPRACEGQGEEHQHRPGARGDRAQHVAAEIALATGDPRVRSPCFAPRLCSRTASPTTSRTFGSRRRAMRSGAALLAAGRPAEAAAVYREDLKHYPENGWALHGLGRPCARREWRRKPMPWSSASAGPGRTPTSRSPLGRKRPRRRGRCPEIRSRPTSRVSASPSRPAVPSPGLAARRCARSARRCSRTPRPARGRRGRRHSPARTARGP